MKKLLIILLFLPLFAQAQTVIYTGAITQTTVQKGGYGADRIFVAPLLDTATINGLFPTLRDTGRITINNGTLYYHDGVGWVSTITGTSGNFVTTAQLADTAAAIRADIPDLTGYVTRPELADSTSDIRAALSDTALGLRTAINLRVRYTDTAAMLLPYATAIGLRVRYSDTAAMLLPYATAIAARARYTDTATIFQTLYNSSRNDVKVNGNTLGADLTFGTSDLFNVRLRVQNMESARWITIPSGGSAGVSYYVQLSGSNARVLTQTQDQSIRGCLDGTNDARFRWRLGTGGVAGNGGHLSLNQDENTSLFNGIASTALNQIGFYTNNTLRGSFNTTGGYTLVNKWVAYNNTTPQNGQIPIGDALGGVWTMNTITAGINMIVTNGSASITLSTDTTDGVTKIATQGDITRALATSDTLVSTSSNITLSKKGWYSYSGTTGTWTLPVVAGTLENKRYIIKNRGSGNLTINSNAGGNDIYDTSAVSFIVLLPGGSCTMWSDGTFFNHKN